MFLNTKVACAFFKDYHIITHTDPYVRVYYQSIGWLLQVSVRVDKQVTRVATTHLTLD